MSETEAEEYRRDLVALRQGLRQLLAENGVGSNPGWTTDDILKAFRGLLPNRVSEDSPSQVEEGP